MSTQPATPPSGPQTGCLVCGEAATKPWTGRHWHIPGRDRQFTYVACARCGSLSCAPVPTEAELAYYYGTHFDYGWYRQRASLKKIQAKARWRRAGRILKNYGASKGRLLDIGCGHGHFVNSAKRDGWEAWGVDFASDATAYGRETLKLKIVEGTLGTAVRSGQLPARTFDFITAWHCAEHVSEQREFFDLIAGLLAPGGLLLIAVPNAEATGMKSRREEWTWCQQPYLHVVHYTARGLTAAVAQSGLTVAATWSRDTWDGNWLSDEVFGDAPKVVAKQLAKLHWRLGFGFEEGVRLACYAIGGIRHWAFGLEGRGLDRAELSLLASSPPHAAANQPEGKS
ncbi:MAG: class I SAM-dependent methyltransferase [Opitutaceae bacterium]|nr:class I SAM-dependent methyltransferase [Opitutaceae bacterium]